MILGSGGAKGVDDRQIKEKYLKRVTEN